MARKPQSKRVTKGAQKGMTRAAAALSRKLGKRQGSTAKGTFYGKASKVLAGAARGKSGTRGYSNPIGPTRGARGGNAGLSATGGRSDH